MKKLLALILILVCVTSFAAAESIDLSGLSFDQLMELRNKLNAEIISRAEWKEVTVPAGTWIVGEDIPAGTYSITPKNGGAYLRIRDTSGDLLVYGGIRDANETIGKFKLGDGYTVEIEDGTLVFAPPVSLGF